LKWLVEWIRYGILLLLIILSFGTIRYR
jgi:hypothetical protein